MNRCIMLSDPDLDALIARRSTSRYAKSAQFAHAFAYGVPGTALPITRIGVTFVILTEAA
jgi:hypothetical protein